MGVVLFIEWPGVEGTSVEMAGPKRILFTIHNSKPQSKQEGKYQAKLTAAPQELRERLLESLWKQQYVQGVTQSPGYEVRGSFLAPPKEAQLRPEPTDYCDINKYHNSISFPVPECRPQAQSSISWGWLWMADLLTTTKSRLQQYAVDCSVFIAHEI